MINKENQIFLEKMEDRIMDYKLDYSLFKKYCDYFINLYSLKLEIDYLKYAYLLSDANVIEPNNQKDLLELYEYKYKIKNIVKELEEQKKTK